MPCRTRSTSCSTVQPLLWQGLFKMLPQHHVLSCRSQSFTFKNTSHSDVSEMKIKFWFLFFEWFISLKINTVRIISMKSLCLCVPTQQRISIGRLNRNTLWHPFGNLQTSLTLSQLTSGCEWDMLACSEPHINFQLDNWAFRTQSTIRVLHNPALPPWPL